MTQDLIDNKPILVQAINLTPSEHKPLPDPLMTQIYMVALGANELTHCGLVTPYGDRDLGQN